MDCIAFMSTRQALLHQMQRLMHERVLHAPVFELATLHGVGPRVEEPAVGLNAQPSALKRLRVDGETLAGGLA